MTTSRDMFLAVLGHDLRSPLQALKMTDQLLLKPEFSDKARHEAAMRIQRASTAMDLLISDLLEFTRTRLGSGIPIQRTTCDLVPVCTAALETIRAGNPAQSFEEHVTGDLVISGDAPRLQQALVNLLSNAVQHGERGKPVSIIALAADDGIEVRVTNFGRPIPASALQTIFEPLIRTPHAGAGIHEQSKTSLGSASSSCARLWLAMVAQPPCNRRWMRARLHDSPAGSAGRLTLQEKAQARTSR